MTPTSVRVRLFAAARAVVGSNDIEAAPGTIDEICARLALDYPKFAQVRPACSFLVDGVAVRDSGTSIAPGSILDVLPPFAGG